MGGYCGTRTYSENIIAMGRPEASYEEVVAAAKKARCYDFIMRQPYGFDTIVGLALLVVGVIFFRALKSE